MEMVRRGEVYWVNLDPTVGTEIKKTRPALVVSPDDLNSVLP
jgi:mRNA interferase MazF